MRLLVIGTGSIGMRHGRNLVALGQDVTAWDADPARLAGLAALPGVTRAASLEAGLAARPDAVVVCTPPATHVALARHSVEAGAHVFVEKPIAPVSDEVPELIDLARRHGRVLIVGFNLRFLPSLARVKALLDAGRIGRVHAVRAEFGFHLPDWRPGRDYRDNYAVSREQGGGILLDAIHELDYLGWMLGDVSEVFCAAGHVSDLAGDTEDLAEITLRFAGGALGQVHLDYVRRAYRRTLELIGAAGVIEWDYPACRVTVRGPAPDAVEVAHAGDDGPAETMYVVEMQHFLHCCEGRAVPRVDGDEALRSLRLVEAAKASAASGGWVKP
ncbi:MAG: Gfo/Idh/MocA family oxidoreductase [Candidatus Rokuibacteriota bacterium]